MSFNNIICTKGTFMTWEDVVEMGMKDVPNMRRDSDLNLKENSFETYI